MLIEIRNMTDTAFKAYARQRGLSERDIILADLILRQELTTKETANKMNLSEATINVKRPYIKRMFGLL